MALRDRMRRLRREAQKDTVLVHQRDGTVRAFRAMDALMDTFMLQAELIRGNAYESEIVEAVRNATPESRAAFEEEYGTITPTVRISASEYEGGWVEEFNLLEDGVVERVYHEGGSEEADCIRREARGELKDLSE
jgi:hypothetical protein